MGNFDNKTPTFGLDWANGQKLVRGECADLLISVGREYDDARDYEISLCSPAFGRFLIENDSWLGEVRGIPKQKFIIRGRNPIVTMGMITVTCSDVDGTNNGSTINDDRNDFCGGLQRNSDDTISIGRMAAFIDWVRVIIDSPVDLFAATRKGGPINEAFVLFDPVRMLIFLGMCGLINSDTIASEARKFAINIDFTALSHAIARAAKK